MIVNMTVKNRKSGYTVLKLKLISMILLLDSMQRFVSDTERKEGLMKLIDNLKFALRMIK